MEGDTIHVFTALGYEQNGTEAILSYRNNHAILSFPTGVDTVAIFTGILPCQYLEPSESAGNGLSAYVHYTSDEATETGNIVWALSIERIGDNYQDIDNDSFGAESSVVTAPPNVSGKVLICNTGLNLDGTLTGDSFRLKIERKGTSESDTAEVTAQLLAIELREV